MENEIKKLMEKYDRYVAEEGYVGTKARISGEAYRDFQSLLAFKQKNCCGKPVENGINKLYERFKHLDVLLSDPVAMNEDKDPIHSTCYDLWKVIKAEAIENG